MSLAIIVPVKSPKRAKHRLAALLSEEERYRLASAMARDVFRAVRGIEEYPAVVVSDDPDILHQAERFGLEPFEDRICQGQSAAVQQGFSLAWDRGHTAAMTVPGDVPAVTSDELRLLATHRPEVEVLLVTDRDRIGTNGLRLVPPHAITLRFGEDSLNLHRAEAARANRSFALLEMTGLQVDLDQPADVAAFLRLERETETLSLLQELKAADRLLARSQPRV